MPIKPVHRTNCSFGSSAVALLVTLLGAASVTSAEVIHVPGDAATIQGAIDLAADGDEIVVAPGEYHELINLLGKAVHLRSADGAEATLISGRELNDSVVRCVSGEGPGTIIEGFTITEGVAANPATGVHGGGMLIDASSPTVRDCRFVNNFAAKGGGLAVRNGSAPVIEDSLFERNGAVGLPSISGFGCGGAVMVDESSAAIRNTCFIANRAEIGGGLFCDSNAAVIVTECVFGSNTVYDDSTSDPSESPGYGGAVFATGESSVTIHRCFLDRNSARSGGAIATGGQSGLNHMTLLDSLLIENLAENLGHAIKNDLGDIRVDRCRFRNHRGLIPFLPAAGVGITNWSLMSVRNSTFVSNQGRTFLCVAGGVMDVTNCTIYDNKAPDDDLFFTNEFGVLAVRNSILWNNGVDPIYNADIAQSNVHFGTPGKGNIDADPLFTDEAQRNLRPQADSPAIDAGLNDLVGDDRVDLDHRPRIVDGNGDGSAIVDLGPYEFIPGGCDDPFSDEVMNVRIESDDKTLAVKDGFSVQLRAYADLADGSAVDITDHPCASWTTSNASIVTISSSGEAFGVTVGDATIAISIEGQQATIPVVVELNGEAAYALDDGIADMSTLTPARSHATLNQFEIQLGAEIITEILVDWGDFAFGPGTVKMYLWSDPNQDGVPDDAQVLAERAVAGLPSHGVYQRYEIPPTYVGAAGTSFFAGFLRTMPDDIPVNTYRSLTVDTNSPQLRSWWAGSFDQVDPHALGKASAFAVIDWANWLIRADGIPGLPGDLNEDGIVNGADLLLLLDAWGDCAPGEPCEADLNDDGTVNVLDLLILLSAVSTPGT